MRASEWALIFRCFALGLLLLVVTAPDCAFASDYTFSGYYAKGIWGMNWWPLAIGLVVAIAAGATVIFTGGTGGPVVVAFGSWIGGLFGLKGAAATSFGLALLGGGSLASGGFGMAGGAAVVTAIITVSPYAGKVAAQYSYDKFNEEEFKRNSLSMLSLPLPRVQSGPKDHASAIRDIEELYEANLDGKTPDQIKDAVAANQRRVYNAISKSETVDATAIADTIARSRIFTDRALMYFHVGDHARTKMAIELAIGGRRPENAFVKRSNEPIRSLQAVLWAASALAEELASITPTLQALEYAIITEPERRVAPIMLAVYLDRLMQRDDLLRPEHLRKVHSLRLEIADRSTRTTLALILAYRSLIMANLNRYFVREEAEKRVDGSGSRRKEPAQRIIARLERSMKLHDVLMIIVSDSLRDVREDVEYMKVEKNRSDLRVLDEQRTQLTSERGELDDRAKALLKILRRSD